MKVIAIFLIIIIPAFSWANIPPPQGSCQYDWVLTHEQGPTMCSSCADWWDGSCAGWGHSDSTVYRFCTGGHDGCGDTYMIYANCYKCAVNTTDSDNDGWYDTKDPWPNDPNCPGQGAKWIYSGRWTRKSDNCQIAYFEDVVGNCGSFETSTCPAGVNPGDGGVDAWWFDIPYNNDPKSYNDIVPPDAPKPPTESPPTQSEASNAEELRLLRNIDDAIKGQSSTESSSLSELLSIHDSVTNNTTVVSGKLDTINTNLGTKLDAVKQAIVDKPGVSMAGVESRLDTANSHLSSIKDKIPSLGEEVLPDGDTSSMENNDDLNDAANQTKLETEKNTLKTYLDSFIANSPIASLVNGSGVTASGSSSFSVSAMGATLVFDFSSASGALDTIGVFLVAFAGLAGIVIVLRD